MMKEIAVYVAGKLSAEEPADEEWNVKRLKWFTEQICLDKDRYPGLKLSAYPTAYTGDWKHKCGFRPIDYYESDNIMLKRCDVTAVQPEGRPGGYETSIGTKAEIELTHKIGNPVRVGLDSLREWLQEVSDAVCAMSGEQEPSDGRYSRMDDGCL